MIYLNEIVSLNDISKSKLKKNISQVLKYLKIDSKKLSLTICGDKYMQNLNKKYRHKNKPTDVLSFPQEDDSLLGDIVISLPVTKKNCRSYGTTLYEELMILIVHGIVHLLGYDHQDAADEQQMQALENKIMLRVLKKKYYA